MEINNTSESYSPNDYEGKKRMDAFADSFEGGIPNWVESKAVFNEMKYDFYLTYLDKENGDF